MNKNYSEIAFILDRSGSMESCRDAAIEGFNQFLREQQQAKGSARLTLVLFDDEYLVPVSSIPVAEVIPLDRDTYTTGKTTALLDAVGRTIDEIGARLAALREADRPGQVIVAILTDGLENASRRFSWPDIAAKIKHQTETYNWDFLFLGANQDAIATAAQLSIAAANSATYVADVPGSRAVHRSLSRKMHSLRRTAMGTATLQEQADAAAPMADLVEEEDRKERSE